MNDSQQAHWDKVYASKPTTEVSWYEPYPARSLEFIGAINLERNAPVIDIGGGASFLVEALLERGFSDLTVLDISAEVLNKQRERLGARGAAVTFLQQDVTNFHPQQRFALWHDRAVFHFLVRREDRVRYVAALRQALRPGGHVIIATFGPAGPERCSGLPVTRYDAAALAAELGGEFTLVESSLSIHHTPAGYAQQFLSCRFRSAPHAP